MLSNCEKMVVISSTTNEWPHPHPHPQNHPIDEKTIMTSTNNRLMDNKETQQPLKCPRCDSSNTKFCYYNNYSLSQPRHFCKACKRYWTRGGTLRNVPVGGGCRKNKRVKRTNATSSSSSSINEATSNPNPNPNPHHFDISSNPINNPMFYNPFSPFEHGVGLGFSTGLMSSIDGFNPIKQIQPNSLISPSFNNLGFGNTSSSSQSMASLVLKGSQVGGNNNFNGFEELQIGDNNGVGVKQVKGEDGPNRLDWNMQMDQIGQIGLSDPLYWNVNGWHDGSSVTSLI